MGEILLVGIKLMIVLGLSILITLAVRKYALSKNILDIPNQRSSHSIPTPRGGGLAFVIIMLLAMVILMLQGTIIFCTGMAITGGGLIVASIGWLDDKNGLSSRFRAFFHFLAAAWALYWLGGLPNLDIGFMTLEFRWAGTLVATIGIVWMINLYNFMDGIDGIAGIEAVIVAGAAGIFLLLNGDRNLASICGLIACSVAGFLMWNWPPAKIFMGDVGSGFLGYIFAVLAIASEKSGALPLIIWLILLGVFIVDATVTLIRRISKGEKWSEAHRSHVYQLATQYGYKHKQVTLAVLCINILLGIIAFAALKWHESLLFFAIGAMCILVLAHVVLYRKFTIDRFHRKHSIASDSLERTLTEAAAHCEE